MHSTKFITDYASIFMPDAIGSTYYAPNYMLV